MEPRVKRRRLGESLEEWDGAEVDDEWEEYDGDDDTEATPVEQGQQQQQQQQLRCAEKIYGHQLAVDNSDADGQSQSTIRESYETSGRVAEDTSHEIDPAMSSGTVFDSRHTENRRHEVAVDIPGQRTEREEEGLGQDDDDDGDGDGDGDEDEDENEEDGALARDSSDHEMPDADHQNINGRCGKLTTAIENQPWPTECEDADAMPDYMQLHGPYPDPDYVDSISGYSRGLAADDGHSPSLISGLYDGGGLRYASPLGPYGASPFALGPWEMLPQFQEAYGVPNLSGLSPARAANYRYRDHPPVRTLASLTSPISGDKRPKSMQHATAYSPKDDDREQASQSANLFEQHPEEASAYFAEDNPAVSPGRTGHGVHAKSSLRRSANWHAAIMEDSDTVEDAVFSAEEIDASSQTGDDLLPSNHSRKPDLSNRVIPDSQDTVPSQRGDKLPTVAATARASYNKPSHQDFDLACVLSDDETPLFTLPPGATAGSNNNVKKLTGTLAKSGSVGTSGVSSDDAAARRQAGLSKKRPRNDGRGRKSDSRLPKTHKSRSVGSTLKSSGPRSNTTAGNGSVPPRSAPFVSNISSTTATANESEAESASRKKRGRPRKSETTQQQAQQQQAQQQQQQQQQAQQQAHQPFMHYPPHMFGQPCYFPPFPFGFQPQAYYPFQPMMPQPFQPYPASMAYQPLQSPFFPQPAVQLQQQLLHRTMQPLLQQTPAQRPLAPTGDNAQQPVKRKRGRPRKYPVGYKRCRRKVQKPNGVTALVGNRLPATEDVWYGVARRLAQDISSLQGGYLFSNGFQMQAQAYDTVRQGPHAPPPESQYPVESSESSSDSELEDDDTGRITEVLDTADDGMSPELLSRNTSRAHGPETLDSSEGSVGSKDAEGTQGTASPGSPGSFANNDEAGLMEFPASPKSVARSVEPTPPPPSPPSSTRRSSQSIREEHIATTPTPARTVVNQTSTPFHAAKSRAPGSHKSDAFGLPTSPLSAKKLRDTPLVAGLEQVLASQEPADDQPKPDEEDRVNESADTELPDSEEDEPFIVSANTELPDSQEEELNLPIDEDVSTVVQEDEHIHQVESSAELQSTPSNHTTTTARSPSVPLAAVESASSATKTPKTPKSSARTSSLTSTSRKLFQSPVAEQVANATEIVRPLQPQADEKWLSGVRTRASSPSLFVSSPVQTPVQAQAPPQTPDKPSQRPAAAVTPWKSPVSRAAMVPRSVERCTPIFLDVKRAPPTRLPSVTEKRTMGELKQAIIAPTTKIQAAKPCMHEPDLLSAKQLSLKSMFARTASRNPSGSGRIEHSRLPPVSLPAVEARRSSSLQAQTTKSIVASKPSKSHLPASDTVKDKKRHKSRRSLLSLVSGRAKGEEADDDDDDDDNDELGSPVQSRKHSSSKSAQYFTSGKSRGVADSSAHKSRKSTSRTTQEDQVQLELEKTKDPDEKMMKMEKKKKKRRRHTDGLVSKHSRSAASDDACAVQECGVDGYTCNRDFCFTCL